MKIDINKFGGGYNGKECFVHARMCAYDENYYVMTMQKLYVGGTDLFSSQYVSISRDGGKSWSEPKADDAFASVSDKDGIIHLGCDGTLLMHQTTKTAVLTGHTVSYAKDGTEPVKNFPFSTFYSVFDKQSEKFTPMKCIEIPPEYHLSHCAAGCSQFIEEENGDLLIPVYIKKDIDECMTSAVMRCAFDGKNIKFKNIGNELSFKNARGLCEPSICKFKDKYYLTIRNDNFALYSTSDDGLNFRTPKFWRWDTGDILPSYNTQQHWLIQSGKLYLVYTRKAGNNDHVFRHRAPLFMAEVDTQKMQILRSTERIVAPERGARLGNFGVSYINEHLSVITAAEWMQPAGCEKYGSDNSIWITKVTD